MKAPKRRIAPKALVRFKERVRELTRRTRGVSTERIVEKLARYLRAGAATSGTVKRHRCWKAREVDPAGCVAIWKQWKQGSSGLRSYAPGSGRELAAQTAGSAHGSWRLTNSPALSLRYPMLPSILSGFPD